MKAKNAGKTIESFFKIAGIVGFIADALAIYQLIRVLSQNQSSWPTDKIIGLAAIIILAFLFSIAFMYFGNGDENLLALFGVVYIVYSATFLLLGGLYAINGVIVRFVDMLYFIVPSLVVSLFAYFMVWVSNIENELISIPFVLTSLAHISWYMFRAFSGGNYNTSLTWNVFLIIQFALLFLFYRLAKIQRKVSMNPDDVADIDFDVNWNFSIIGKTAYNTLSKMGIFSVGGFLAGLIIGAIIGGIIGLIGEGWDGLWTGIVNGSGLGGLILGAILGFFGGIAYIDETNDTKKSKGKNAG